MQEEIKIKIRYSKGDSGIIILDEDSMRWEWEELLENLRAEINKSNEKIIIK